MRRAARALAALALICAALGAWVSYFKATQPIVNDFHVYYRASTALRDARWDDVYEWQKSHYPFRYAPLTLPLFVPLAWMEEHTARAAWFLLQLACLISAWLAIHRLIARQRGADFALLTTSAAFLLTFRYFLDSFWCGQVSGVLFLLFTLFCLGSRASLAAAAALKVGPGLAFLADDFGGWRRRRTWFAVAGTLAALQLLALALLPHAPWAQLYRDWLAVVRADDGYFDSSTARNQAIYGAALRLGLDHPWLAPWAGPIWKLFVAAGFGLSLWLGSLATRLGEGRAELGLIRSLGVLLYVVLMPQALPYALLLLGLPIALLLASRRPPWVALSIFALLGSIPGTDVVGYRATEWIQWNSLPLAAALLLLACGLSSLPKAS
jgi:hypothetical protein